MASTTIFGWYLGNLPSIETDPASLLGTYGSAGSILSRDALSLVARETDGFVDENTPGDTLTYDIGAGPVTAQLEEMVYYTARVVATDGVTRTADFWAIQMTNGDVVLLNDLDADSASFSTTPVESVTLTGVIGGNYSLAPGWHTAAVAPACFCPGTLIATPGGPRAVETLCVGDSITTADHGPQTLRWTGVQRFRFDRPDAAHMPIEIKAAALGPRLPRQALVLSPQHRILIAGHGAEVLAPAKAFLALPAVRHRRSCRRVEYHCLLFDRHELLFANDLAVESFRPGAMGLSGFGPIDRLRIRAFYPGLGAGGGKAALGPAARPILGRRGAETLLRRLRAQGQSPGRGPGGMRAIPRDTRPSGRHTMAKAP